MKNIFEYIGYVPHRMVFDNLSAAVISIEKNGDRKLTEGFIRFKNHYGFEASFCNARAR
ncbi:MAG TPA: transposase [Epulopiscium sp.]|nr:transposase [Candidatus Epulonipiscium sp.]